MTALSVDHGLRDGSAGEARQVGVWLAARGIDHAVLKWRGDKPESAVQDRARQARYRLLEEWCRDHGVLHLLVGHTLEDQAETQLMRLQLGSGPDGLAGMSTIRELSHCRLLRPLLSVRRDDLRAFLRAEGQDWFEDPSNQDARFGRVAARRLLADPNHDLDPVALFESARRYGVARAALELETDRLLARSCRLFGSGYATLDAELLCSAPDDLALRALARVLAGIGGLSHLPKRNSVERLHGALIGGEAAATLGQCLVQRHGPQIGIYRERRNRPPAMALAGLTEARWDRRFDLTFSPGEGSTRHLRALDPTDWPLIVADAAELRAQALPRAALWGLPAVADDSGILAVPHLQYRRGRPWPERNVAAAVISARFRPVRAASLAAFCVA